MIVITVSYYLQSDSSFGGLNQGHVWRPLTTRFCVRVDDSLAQHFTSTAVIGG